MIPVGKIKDLEKKYMDKIYDIFSSSDFKSNLFEIEDYIKNNYDFLDNHWGEKNKIKVGVERLIRFYFYRKLNVVNIYPSPLSADMAIELDDVILNIDAKTIDMVGNAGDDVSIHFQKNQITFNNNPFFARQVQGYNFAGVSFPAYLKPFYKNKPCLTFFVTINYFDNAIAKTFRLSHMSLCCVPHKKVVDSDFNNDIISNYKTYEYIKTVKARTLGTQFAPVKTPDQSWIAFPLKGLGNNDAYLDPNQDNPLVPGSKSVRKEIDGKWAIVTFGGSARIDKTDLLSRIDSKGRTWNGVKRLPLTKKNETLFV